MADGGSSRAGGGGTGKGGAGKSIKQITNQAQRALATVQKLQDQARARGDQNAVHQYGQRKLAIRRMAQRYQKNIANAQGAKTIKTADDNKQRARSTYMNDKSKSTRTGAVGQFRTNGYGKGQSSGTHERRRNQYQAGIKQGYASTKSMSGRNITAFASRIGKGGATADGIRQGIKSAVRSFTNDKSLKSVKRAFSNATNAAKMGVKAISRTLRKKAAKR